MVSIFSKKKFLLRNPENPTETHVTKVQDFDTVPDWATHDDTFAMAKKAGDIQVMTGKKDGKKAAGGKE